MLILTIKVMKKKVVEHAKQIETLMEKWGVGDNCCLGFFFSK